MDWIPLGPLCARPWATTAEVITHLCHPGTWQDTPLAVAGTSVTFTRPGWEASGHLPIFHPPHIPNFCFAPGILFVAPAQEQMQSKRWKQEELLQLAGTGGNQVPSVALWFTPVGSWHSFSHNITAEMDSWTKGEIPVNSHLKITWILYSQAI